uniref:Transmembrane 9 superfamily member n=1 Tax=Angiostrongylus cantonensis TaxID=6313 RepID=A0A0K0DNM2_ANGCA
LERKAKYKDKHITWETECPVFVVYGYDPCRGELDYDQNTMDDLSYKEAEEIEKNIDKQVLCTSLHFLFIFRVVLVLELSVAWERGKSWCFDAISCILASTVTLHSLEE